MTCSRCKSSARPCGCCEGVAVLTPASRWNPPGASELRYRAGTHGAFFATMKARLSTVTVEAPVGTLRPLQGLTTRDADDPAVALLDGWATVGDVLTFYQERIANEGYLRTATERRSALELARLVGYEARPGVASTAYLAYALEDSQLEPVEIPSGSRCMTIPGPGEQPQSFETVEPLVARKEWNNLAPRASRPQAVTLANVLALESLHVEGADLQLAAGVPLLLEFEDGDGESIWAVRVVDSVEADYIAKTSEIVLQPVTDGLADAAALLVTLLLALDPQLDAKAIEAGFEQLAEALLGEPTFEDWPGVLLQADLSQALHKEFEDAIKEITKSASSDATATSAPEIFVDSLLKDAKPQVSNATRLERSLATSLAAGADAVPQILLQFAPKLKDTYYEAWRGATPSTEAPALKGVHAMGTSGLLFGATAAKQINYVELFKLQTGHFASGATVATFDGVQVEWTYADDEFSDNAYLDGAHSEIAPDSLVMFQVDRDGRTRREVRRASAITVAPRSAYGITGSATRLDVDDPWRIVGVDSREMIGELRRTQVYVESRELTLIDEPITDDVYGSSLELGELYDGLTSGRWVILEGERADIEGVDGVLSAELLMISGVVHGYDEDLPGDTTKTTLLLATETAYRYKRDKVVLHGNVAKATLGETRSETLGSGDGSVPLQSFELRQPPLTFVSASTPEGAESTLRVYVDGVEWKEAETFDGLGATERRFVTRTDDSGVTTVTFGDGEHGARLPTGVENVKAIYRNGIGKAGNARAGQISLLVSRPLGVKSVINPLAAAGGADAEDRDAIRDNAPSSVQALERLVSVSDYADFARRFAGIGKAAARRLSDGGREIVHVTVAGSDDATIDPASDLYQNLVDALRLYGDPGLGVKVEARELVALALSAGVKLLDGHVWETVSAALRERVLERFGFDKRSLAQPALLSDVIATLQRVRGVAYVDVDVFGGIPEKVTDDATGVRRLLTQDEIAAAVEAMGGQPPSQRVDALAARNKGVLQPAQLAIFSAAVPDTLILNEIP